jgi:uroporphyrinogen decarboxylase
MNSRERLLTALNNGKPDHLPAQVHGWIKYYLDHYLGGCDQYAAYARFGLDAVIYVGPTHVYSPRDLDRWIVERRDLGADADGVRQWVETVTTPGGTLTKRGASNPFTTWETEPLIKTQADFELFAKYAPIPTRCDSTPVWEAKEKIGDRGIVRGHAYGFGQGSPWQDLCILMGTQEAIMAAMDEPAFIHRALEVILEKRLRWLERWARAPFDLIECGGGAGSNTVISPKMFREFCLPYDQRQHKALHDAGKKIVYHLCGGLMQMLDMVAENGADGLETMTPPSMGGDCDLAEAKRRVGNKLFFIGGLDQNAGFEKGTPESIRAQVFALHAACPNGGYICSPSDHFFFGDPANLQAFADAAKECRY